MVITQINRKPVKDLASAREILADHQSGEGVLLLVKTQSGSRFVALGS
jgi:hypothetical protein